MIIGINICYDPSSELPRQGCSDEGSRYMVSMKNKKNYHQILSLIKSSVKRHDHLTISELHYACSVEAGD